MSLNGYFLRGIDGETLLVFRTGDPEEVFRIITRLAASRDKEIRALAQKLELEWYKREFENKKNDNIRRIRRGPKSPDTKAAGNG